MERTASMRTSRAPGRTGASATSPAAHRGGLPRDVLDAAIATLATQSLAHPTETVLANGLRVLVLEDHRAPVVAHSLWYRVGSIDETSGTTGLAHLFEHMMFNGTRRYGPGEYDKQMRAIGAYANALTWTDYTAYTVEAPAARLGDVMALEAERMIDLAITDAEFAREVRVVMEERRQSSDDDPTGLLYESLYACAFHASPQRWPIIGWMSDLETMQAGDARDWYARWYRPDNAILVVAGDVVPTDVFALATRHFGGIAAGGERPRRVQQEPRQRGQRRIESYAHTPVAQIAIGFKVPRLSADDAGGKASPRATHEADRQAVHEATTQAIHEAATRAVHEANTQAVHEARAQAPTVDDPAYASSDDVYALAILAELLDWGRMLEGPLVRQKRLADETWASYDYLMRVPGLFIIGAVCAMGVTPARVERALRTVLARIASDGIDEAALRRVRTQLLSSRVYRADSVFDQADELGRMAILGLSEQIRTIDQKLAAVTAEQVKTVAGRYFSEETMTVAVLLPDEEDDGDEADDEEADAEDKADAEEGKHRRRSHAAGVET